ncbi:hypothetical protein K0M31_007325 [Melipona bicolor]|uniref:Uncharacterized protein n=1 Tax=Melipona bicolor TaxID=60889 RepID=A0AA40GB71_9HYME|nr:hypothetical protein K0M31_007325 [Melipona bicolor]
MRIKLARHSELEEKQGVRKANLTPLWQQSRKDRVIRFEENERGEEEGKLFADAIYRVTAAENRKALKRYCYRSGKRAADPRIR